MSAKPAKSLTITTRPRTSSSDSAAPSLRTPRTARFAEATAVNSPIEPRKLPFSERTVINHYAPQPQPSDIGFGYMNEKHISAVTVEMEETEQNNHMPSGVTPQTPLMSPPLKSAMKTPGAAPRNFGNILSPTFHEEEALEKHEESTDVQQAKDLKVKTRVRMAKMLLRGVNFSCSLIVLSMLATTFNIFNATKSIPPRNNLPPWALGQKIWPQVTLLCISCISLFMSMVIFYAYWKGGHRRAEKAAVYYTSFAVVFFVFSIVMWGIGAGVLNQSKASSNGQDMWGWSCKDNKRASLFQDDIHYALICRLQNWSLVCCIIEVVVETITIAVYAIVFYRFYSKRQLRKSMAVRDRARSDLYLAQLRSQSAPNTPGFAPANGPFSPRDGGWRPPADYTYTNASAMEEANGNSGARFVDPAQKPAPRPFVLQPPPLKLPGSTPKMAATGFTPLSRNDSYSSRTPTPPRQVMIRQNSYEQGPASPREEFAQEHFAAAPGERVYESVPIPGAYASPVASPTGPRFPG